MIVYTLKVTEIKKETEDTITLCFKQPGLRKIKYVAGQYLTLIFKINGRRYARPYSFSSTPGIDTLIEVTIKRVQNGIVSNHIHDMVQVGDAIEVMEPMGDFIFVDKKGLTTVYLWGVGSGITPLISIIKKILAENQAINVNLVYGNRNHDTVIFFSLIEDLLAKYAERFKVWYFYTKLSLSVTNPYIIEGRINKAYALSSILNEADVLNSNHYICGPAGLKESVKDALDTLNVSADNIFSEDFELIKDIKDFDDLHTQKVKVKLYDEQYDLEVVKGKSILEAALDAGLDIPYSCQTGNCSTCKAAVLSGEVKMIGLTKQREDLKIDECLLCCSHPLSANVYVEFK